MKLLTYFKQSLSLSLLVLLLGTVFFVSDSLTKQIISTIIFLLYTATSSKDIWDITHSARSTFIWILWSSICFSFLFFAIIQNKRISTWFYFLTFIINLSILATGIAIFFITNSCSNLGEKNNPNSGKHIFAIIMAILILIILLEGYTIFAVVLGIVSMSLYNHYSELNISDIMTCLL